MTTLAGRKIRRYRTDREQKLSRAEIGAQFHVSFSTVQGWEEDGKVPRAGTMARIVATGIVTHADWFTPADCPRCGRATDEVESCVVRECPMAVHRSAAA